MPDFSVLPYAAPSCDSVASRPCGYEFAHKCDTVACHAGASCSYERPALLEELAARGVRLTPQRRAIVAVVQEAEEHLDAASLLARAQQREPNIDRATVYRTMELLKSFRLIDELDLMHLKGERHHYEARTRRDHFHLACFRCGAIEEVSSALLEQLKREVAGRAGFDVEVTRLELGGRCRLCRGPVRPD